MFNSQNIFSVDDDTARFLHANFTMLAGNDLVGFFYVQGYNNELNYFHFIVLGMRKSFF